MEHAIQQLNPEQRTCIQLFYLDKKSYQEIADKTGYSLLQVKSYIQNGKRNLKLLLEKQQRTNH
jgi:RNA polymerase sigma-70 factor (ECF subfamily)